MFTEKQISTQTRVFFLVVAIDLLGFGILIPLLPTMFREAGSPIFIAGDISEAYVYLALGAFTAVYGFGQFFANPILGGLSDKFGRKNIFLYAVFGTLVSRFIILFGVLSQSFWLVIFAKGLDGATGGIIALVNASIADITTKENRARYLGLIGAAIGAGFVLGPAFGGLLSLWQNSYAIYAPFVLGILLSIIAFVISYFKLKETLPALLNKKDNTENEIEKIKIAPINEIKKVLKNINITIRDKTYTKFFLVAFIFNLGFSCFTPFAGVFLKDFFAFSPLKIGIYMTLVGITIAVAQGFLAYKFIKKYGEIKILLLGMFIASSTIAVTIVFTGIAALAYISAIVIAFGVSLTQASMANIFSKRAGEKQGLVMGSYSSMQVFAIGLAPLLGGIASAYNGSYAVALASFFIFIAFLIVIFWKEKIVY